MKPNRLAPTSLGPGRAQVKSAVFQPGPPISVTTVFGTTPAVIEPIVNRLVVSCTVQKERSTHMQEMSYDPAAASVGTRVVDNSIRGLAAGTAAVAQVTGPAPAGADEISEQAAAAFAIAGLHMVATNRSAQEELKAAGELFHEIARTYSDVDAGAASTFA